MNKAEEDPMLLELVAINAILEDIELRKEELEKALGFNQAMSARYNEDVLVEMK